MAVVIAAPVATMAAENRGPQTDNSINVSTNEVRQALAYTPGVLDASGQSSTSGDADSAIVAATAGATIDVPKDASEGVTIADANGTALDIQLPNADQAGNAKQVAPGVVAYDGTNGSANAVQTDENGGVRMLTIIDNPNAPTSYDYKVTVPTGGRIELTPQGGAVVLTNDGRIITMVNTPWAKDAKGKQIRTWFTTDGATLTQHVQHNVRGVVYPVTADPWWNPLSWFSGFTWVRGVKVLAKKIGPWGWVICAAGGGWAWYRSDSSGWVRVGDAVSGCLL
ncbi:MAG TPA: hypothetical protein VLF43_01920 [Candidatus Saccharimonadales bacterium]|nr:hypothetical protein [Candidatus Saccharimonadales bacterium]